MASMTFSKLSLLSQKERSALQIDFSSKKTVLVAGNGFGKSAILKSLYDTLGAQPHKVDKSWKDAGVTSLLEFAIDGDPYSALKIGSNFTIFDSNQQILINTGRVTAELGPFLADKLHFGLLLADKQDNIRIPPPSYAFAPFYVDQDRSWQRPWDGFRDLLIFAGSAKSLAEYHSGLRPNAYYQAKAERDRIRIELTKINSEREAVDQALRQVGSSIDAPVLALNLESFQAETDHLLREATVLHQREAEFRMALASLQEEQQVWADHVAVLEAAIAELDFTFRSSVEHPPDVECPMCGQHYDNGIGNQFELAADKEDLMIALRTGRTQYREATDKISERRMKISGISEALAKVDEILAVRKQDISLRDVVAAEGRNEALRYLQERLSTLDKLYAEKQRAANECEARMKELDSSKRKSAIYKHFAARIKNAAHALDVRLPDVTAKTIQGLNIGRGSEGPRALAAYYYAFLHTAEQYGSAVFCPVVIDAPNQQGQDVVHLRTIMSFLLSGAPSGAQVIVGAESVVAQTDATIIDVGWKKNRVLREAEYERVSAYLNPFLEQSIL